MNIRRGFHVSIQFWQNPELREMSPLQRGLLADIFSILAGETRKNWWGFLADNQGKPMSERALRAEFGKSLIAASTWHKARDEFLEKGILKNIRLFKNVYLYCPPFVELNPFEMTRKLNTELNKQLPEEKPKLLKSELYMGYDPDNDVPESELDEWGRICRLWLELSDGRPPMSPELSLATKASMKEDLLKIVDEVGIDNALHDMAVAFEYKRRSGGRINSIEYIMVRWRSPDWIKRFDKDNNIKKTKDEYEKMKRTVKYFIEKGTITTIEQLIKQYPNVSAELLDKLGREFGLK